MQNDNGYNIKICYWHSQRGLMAKRCLVEQFQHFGFTDQIDQIHW